MAQSKEAAPPKEGKKSISDWLTIGGDYRLKVDSLRGEVADFHQFTGFDPSTGAPVVGPLQNEATVKNDTILTNRFGLNLKAKATRNVTVTARMLMYKTFGSQDDTAVTGLQSVDSFGNRVVTPFFGDRVGAFDGTQGHLPGDGRLTVDQAYVTWANILDQPIWFSVGRRPSTGGIPTHLRQNNEKPGVGGIPGLLVDYAFDGAALGYAPDIEALPGAYAKLCYGRGFENGITATGGNGLKDTEFLGISVTPYDTDRLYINVQWDRGINIFDQPVIPGKSFFGFPVEPRVDLGDIDWYGITALSTLKNVGPGTLNLFAAGAASITHPNDKRTLVTPSFPGVGAPARPRGSREQQDRQGGLRGRPVRFQQEPDEDRGGVQLRHQGLDRFRSRGGRPLDQQAGYPGQRI